MQGLQPEVRTYNTAIIACNMCGQPHEALKVSSQQTCPKCGPQIISSSFEGWLRCPVDTQICWPQGLADSEAQSPSHAAQGRLHNIHAIGICWHLSSVHFDEREASCFSAVRVLLQPESLRIIGLRLRR